ncbi:MAG: RNase adapter RapZ [Rhodospirillales bacterium]|nr:RNase adapter RapZ [Rhodospirillales bacterium]
MTEIAQASPPPNAEERRRSAGPSAENRLLLVTGLSGAGKTAALKALQDLGCDSIDHLPLALFEKLVPASGCGALMGDRLLAVGVDVRTRDFTIEALMAEVARLDGQANLDLKVVFLSCDDDELCRRYKASRHRHPLAVDRPLPDGIATERQIMAPLRARADLIIDTTALSPGALKRRLAGTFASSIRPGLVILVTSFSYALGLPRDADLVFDVRFLNNPHYQPELRPLTGRDAPVATFLADEPSFAPFFSSLTTLLEPLLPRYAAEGKTYLTIAVGCTGGRHRSVFVVERLAAWLETCGQHVLIEHRGLDRLPI